MKRSTIAHTGRHSDDRLIRKAAHHTGQRPFHAGNDDNDICLLDIWQMGKEPMYPSHAAVIMRLDAIAKEVSRQPCFLGHRNIAGSRRQNQDLMLLIPHLGRIPVKVDRPGHFIIFCFRHFFQHLFVMLPPCSP